MKKLFKSAISLILALTMVLSCASAFAYEKGEYVKWNWDKFDVYDNYLYLGEIEEGKNTVNTDEYWNCVNFDAEKAGFYLFEMSYEDCYEIGVSEKVENGKPINYANLLTDEENNQFIAYLAEGEAFVSFSTETHKHNITVSYFGSEITQLTFAEGTFENNILDCDFWLSENAGGDGFGMYIETINLTFDNSKNFTAKDCKWSFDSFELTNDTYTTDFVLGNYSEEINMTTCEILDYVDKVEISNVEKYLYAVEYFDGSLEADFWNRGIESEKITITFKNSETKTVDFPYGMFDETYVEFPNGKEYALWVNGNTRLTVVIGYERVLTLDCETVEADLNQNLEYLKEELGYDVYFIKLNLDRFFSGLISTRPVVNLWCLSDAMDYIGDMFSSIGEFIGYYIGF